jgi:hypothetical protein
VSRVVGDPYGNCDLIMKTEASYSLGFLVYLQNIYLNQMFGENKFPYAFVNHVDFDFVTDFRSSYTELWEEVLVEISKQPNCDVQSFCEKKDLFYRELFVSGLA